ncbi:hypothetical protein JXQ70_12210 [bacterium]|nr:hypothetical protein [bacterium]
MNMITFLRSMFVYCVMLSMSCASTQQMPPTHSSQIENIPIINVQKEISNHLSSYLVKRYYDPTHDSKVAVKLGVFGNNVTEGPFLAEYYREIIGDDLINAPQFVQVIGDDESHDCAVDLHIMKTDNDAVDIIFLVHDRQSGAVIHSRSFNYPAASVLTDEYRIFAEYYTQGLAQKTEERKKQMAFLTVMAVSQGQSFEISEMSGDSSYYHHSYYSEEGDYYTESTYSEGGQHYSSYYPANITLVLGEKAYRIDPRTDMLFQDYLEPGDYKCSITFDQANYDGSSNRQILGKRYTKKFTITLLKNEVVSLYVQCIYDGEQSHIFLKARGKQDHTEGR